jgi:2-amino-4-hydroxy-6-hydroxymethyldihydropteridine diphosphokinase
MQHRDFVLTPLADIEPEWQHPQLGQTVLELQQQLSANSSEQFILQMVE